MGSLKKLLLNNLLLLFTASTIWAGQMSGGDFVITKDLLGAVGPADSPTIASADFSLAFAWGEPASGNVASEPTYTIVSGYFGGRFENSGTFFLISSVIGKPETKPFYQGQLRVGVSYDASVQLTFSGQLDPSSIAAGIQISIAADHLGRPFSDPVPFTIAT